MTTQPTTSEEKDQKIAGLRSLLTQAKTKIEEYKAQLVQRVCRLSGRRKNQKKRAATTKKVFSPDPEIKQLEGDSANIIKQYEERLVRYQASLEESTQLIEKNQKGMQSASRSHE